MSNDLRLHTYFKQPILLLFQVNNLLILKFLMNIHPFIPLYPKVPKATFVIISDSVRMRSPKREGSHINH